MNWHLLLRCCEYKWGAIPEEDWPTNKHEQSEVHNELLSEDCNLFSFTQKWNEKDRYQLVLLKFILGNKCNKVKS